MIYRCWSWLLLYVYFWRGRRLSYHFFYMLLCSIHVLCNGLTVYYLHMPFKFYTFLTLRYPIKWHCLCIAGLLTDFLNHWLTDILSNRFGFHISYNRLAHQFEFAVSTSFIRFLCTFEPPMHLAWTLVILTDPIRVS